MSRGVKIPRVVLPRKTSDVNLLTNRVSIAMMAKTGGGGVFDDAAFSTIAANLSQLSSVINADLNDALQAEATAKQKRQALQVNVIEALHELRNARDLILSINPENPMVIAEYGFEAYMSTSGSGGGGGAGGSGGGDDGTGGDPTGF